MISFKQNQQKRDYDFISAGRVLLLAFCFSLICSFIITLIFTSIANGQGITLSANPEEYMTDKYGQIGQNICIIYVVLNSVLTSLSMLLAVWIYARLGGYRVDFLPKPSAKSAGMSALLCLLCFLGLLCFVNLMDFGFEKIDMASTFNLPLDNFGYLVISVATYCIVAPICEEIIFRGVLFAGLKTKFLVFWSAIFSALLFAVAHQNINSLLYPFLMGIVLAYVAHFYGIKCSTIFHAINNFLSCIISYLKQNSIINFDFVLSWWGILISVILAIIAFVLVWIILKKISKKYAKNSIDNIEKVAQTKQVSYATILFVAFCVLIIVLNIFL